MEKKNLQVITKLSKNESEELTELITTSNRKNDEKPAPIK